MKKIISFAFALIGFVSSGQVTGNAFLSGQSNHAGIKVKFIANSMTAVTDSAYTTSTGSYSVNLSGGIYYILFSNFGYQASYYNNGSPVVLTTTSSINSVTLSLGNSVFVSGNVGGNWTNNNTYFVQGDLTIPTGSVLTVQPGTKIKFNGNYSIFANGTLLAVGDSVNPIVFTSNLPSPQAGNWNLIDLNNSLCNINYCVVEFSSNGFRFSNSSPLIANSTIRNNSLGGIYCLNGSPNISKNKMYNNGLFGIWVEGFSSSATIQCNEVYNGSSYGIITKSDNTVRNNKVHNNGGKGIWVDNPCSPLIENNYVYQNWQGIDLVSCPSCSPIIVNNTIVNNSSSGISFTSQNPNGKIINNIIVNNNYGIMTGCNTISNNLVWNNSNGNYSNVSVVGIGQIVSTNTNGDPIDSYFNLSQDPLFSIVPLLNSNSPCINAGNQTYSTNIGYNPVYTCNSVLSIFENVKSNVKIIVFPNPSNGEFTISLNKFEEEFSVSIYNSIGQVINHQRLIESDTRINLSGFAQGIYFVKINGTKGPVYHQKIIKE